MVLVLSSPAFEDGGLIPERFTRDGLNLSPPLDWSGAPAQTGSYALIVEDPDAPGGLFTHWLLYDLPPGTRRLSEGVLRAGNLDSGAKQGRNDFDALGYGGPRPPPGREHRYFFRLFALHGHLRLSFGADRPALLARMTRRVIEAAELVGRYGR